MAQHCQDVAGVFQILAHPVRVQILCALRDRELCVQHLMKLLQRPQPYISQHLRILREAGFVATREEGTYVYYHLADPRITALLNEWVPVPELKSDEGDCGQQRQSWHDT